MEALTVKKSEAAQLLKVQIRRIKSLRNRNVKDDDDLKNPTTRNLFAVTRTICEELGIKPEVKLAA